MSNKTLHPATATVIPAYKAPRPVDLDTLADILIMLATDHLEDRFGDTFDFSDVLALFGGAVQTDVVVGSVHLASLERTLAGWVPNPDINNAHNVDAFERAFDHGATDWSGRNADGLPVDSDGAYDPDNHGFFDRFGSSASIGFSECSDEFFTHNTTGEERWA